MINVSAATILVNAAQNIGVPAFSATTHVTAAQALAWLQQGVESLTALTKQKLGDDGDFMQYATLTSVPDFNLVSLPANCGEIMNLFWSKSDTESFIVRRANVGDVEVQMTDVREWVDAPVYRLSGQTLELFPCPSEAYTLALWYMSRAQLSTAADEFVGRLDWSRWLELDLMIKCLQRKRRWVDMQATQGLKTALEVNLFAPSRSRNRAGPVRVRDVETEGGDGNWGRW